jgi:hypothetical protein
LPGSGKVCGVDPVTNARRRHGYRHRLCAAL